MDEVNLQATNQPALSPSPKTKHYPQHITTASAGSSGLVPPRPGPRTFLGRLGYKLNPCCRSKDVASGEPRKAVCSNKRSSALWHFTLFHLPAMLVTSTLLTLHVINLHWSPSHPNIEEMAALQFAAKAQESLILISLTDVLLHRIRYGLLGRNGVPLGFLLSPFNIGFSLRYLASREFWSPAVNPTGKRFFNAITAAMIFLFSLLGLAAGPSAAIAMIPRYNWWQLPDVSAEDRPVVEPNPYLRKFESPYLKPDLGCLSVFNNQTCANHDFETISRVLQTLDITTIRSGNAPPIMMGNITVPSPMTPPHRQITLLVNSYGEEAGGSIAYATTPMEFILAGFKFDEFAPDGVQYLRKSEALKPSGSEKWKQPLVAAHCSFSYLRRPFNYTSTYFEFDDIYYDNFNVTVEFSDFNDSMEYLMKIPTNAGDNVTRSMNPVLLDIRHLLPVPVATSIVFAHSYISSFTDLPTYQPEPEIEIGLCLIQGRWVEADVFLHSKSSSDIQSHLGFPLLEAMDYMRLKSDPEQSIEMTVEWLEGIGVPPESVGPQRKNPAYLDMMNGCIDAWSRGTGGAYCLPGSLAAYLANALARITTLKGMKGDDEKFTPIFEPPGANYTYVYHTYFEHVYAYGFQPSTTLRLAFAALFLQAVIALIHLAVTVFVRRPWHSFAWGSFAQILTLALRSNPPDQLENVGGGVERAQTWKHLTEVREIGDERELQIVIRRHTAMLYRDQTYLNSEEQGPHQLRIPQVGIKYR
ncbi:hypothetical protein NOF04DRAFT_4890 [Fusarium oxysporum II5]|uniref:Uncharacterized protein n=5 Tax=Fusarium oxysporum species complex TaxID=171631 RepID=N1RX08_FUSC4|nr:uncharacterized protein FOIG_16700 [Fusarium odoratissimum NRRL 54006]EMT68722.1 hypothetical protein FOC4_g10000301 [Fusarium odoratissimum]ENH70223.1 hypothetical protein FOC1_g10000847 [Fusarium oxysporum f. sp. cubense race 1]EXL90022.1 hypothetical protein FOIG_16700 [Fusarium odoratissimum NRRL 54006]KAK2122150.1 hypothetical protein NOF04DRAFT_4890 [Fusarium oxysporum II5]